MRYACPERRRRDVAVTASPGTGDSGLAACFPQICGKRSIQLCLPLAGALVLDLAQHFELACGLLVDIATLAAGSRADGRNGGDRLAAS
jgi:hypothetical protein